MGASGDQPGREQRAHLEHQRQSHCPTRKYIFVHQRQDHARLHGSFSSIASPGQDAFILFDNVRVELASIPTLPVISAQPQSLSVYQGQDALFTVSATASGTLTYQWLFEGSPIPGATSNSLTVTNVLPQNIGAYSVVVANGAGPVTSSNASLTLRDSPYISGVAASPGQRAAIISWATAVPSDSRVQYGPGGNGSSFSSVSDTDHALTTNHVITLGGLSPDSSYSFQVLSVAGTNTYLSGVYQFTTAGTLILDNPTLTLTGSWTTNNTSPDKYADDYVYTTTVVGSSNATATFRPTITTPGKYDVYVWYPQGANRANNAPFTIGYNGGTNIVPVNEQTGGGAWQLLASGLNFAKGTNGFVRLANNANGSVVIADAVRFTYVDGQDTPTNQTVPTWWQNFYFGGPVNPVLDPDADGYTTAQEYVMGTSPTNGSSRLLVSGVRGSNALNVTFWPMLEGRNYQLLYRSDIGLTSWQIVGSSPVGDGTGNGVFSLSTTLSDRGFFRLQVLLSTDAVQPIAAQRASSSGVISNLFSPYVSDPICGVNRAYVR